MKHIHIVNPYGSVAMSRLIIPLIAEFPAIHVVSHDTGINNDADLNFHVPWHTLIEHEGGGKHAILYTHCNPPDVEKLKKACDKADLIICMSFTGKQDLLSLGVDPKKLWVVYSAADSFQFRRRTIGIIGFAQPNGRKRESILMDLAWKYDLSALHFVFVGPSWENTVNTLQSLGVSAQTTGAADDETMRTVYKGLDALLVTGYVEGGPMPVLEAMASGVKVFSPAFGYASDLLPENQHYDTVEDLMSLLEDFTKDAIQNHKLARAWSWKDYAAELAFVFGRLIDDNVDLFPECGMSRYGQLLDIIDDHKPKSIVEIGTWSGSRGIQMIQQASMYNKDIAYQGFDLFDDQTGEQKRNEFSKWAWPIETVNRRLKATRAKIELVCGDTNITLCHLTSADLYFIDGGHSEATIENDWRCVSKSMTNGSVVVFDDYYHGDKPDGVGCNRVIDNINNILYDVKHLPIRTKTDDGLNIGMVKVKKYAGIRSQMQARTHTKCYTANGQSTSSELQNMQSDNVEGSASYSGQLERFTPPFGNGAKSSNNRYD